MVGRCIQKNGQINKTVPKVIDWESSSLDVLTTALAKIEAVINSHPLSYISEEDMEKPITPSHLIMGHWILNLPDNLDSVCDLNDSEFTIDSNQVESSI